MEFYEILKSIAYYELVLIYPNTLLQITIAHIAGKYVFLEILLSTSVVKVPNI